MLKIALAFQRRISHNADMPCDALTIADWFLSRAALDGERLTQMKLQKLVYVAHGWSLGLRDQPLFKDSVEAWRWGPVVRSLYREFANFGSSDIAPRLPECPQLDVNIGTFLDRVWEVYKGFSAIELSAMTHAEGTPWKQTYVDTKPPRTIPNDLIGRHYKELAAKRT
jgi:uncharacterized phage-associated protein